MECRSFHPFIYFQYEAECMAKFITNELLHHMNAAILIKRERKSPQQYGDWRHGLREQMQILQFVQAILQPIECIKSHKSCMKKGLFFTN